MFCLTIGRIPDDQPTALGVCVLGDLLELIHLLLLGHGYVTTSNLIDEGTVSEMAS